MSGNDHRVVIVTGASRGLGREIALQFGANRCRVVVNYREQEDAARATAEEIMRLGGQAITISADVRKPDDIDAMINGTLERWGSIDVLVNNAGVTKDALAIKMDETDWDRVLEIDLSGPFRCIRSASTAMTEQRSGHIINIASISGIRGRHGQANYASAKAGLIGLTKAAAKELGMANIRVNCVLPGYLTTDMGAAAPDEVVRQVLAENTLGRASTAVEVASFVYHLSLMQNISGQVFNLDSRIL